MLRNMMIFSLLFYSTIVFSKNDLKFENVLIDQFTTEIENVENVVVKFSDENSCYLILNENDDSKRLYAVLIDFFERSVAVDAACISMPEKYVLGHTVVYRLVKLEKSSQ